MTDTFCRPTADATLTHSVRHACGRTAGASWTHPPAPACPPLFRSAVARPLSRPLTPSGWDAPALDCTLTTARAVPDLRGHGLPQPHRPADGRGRPHRTPAPALGHHHARCPATDTDRLLMRQGLSTCASAGGVRWPSGVVARGMVGDGYEAGMCLVSAAFVEEDEPGNGDESAENRNGPRLLAEP